MFNGSNCDRKSQLSSILTEPLNPREQADRFEITYPLNFYDILFKVPISFYENLDL